MLPQTLPTCPLLQRPAEFRPHAFSCRCLAPMLRHMHSKQASAWHSISQQVGCKKQPRSRGADCHYTTPGNTDAPGEADNNQPQTTRCQRQHKEFAVLYQAFLHPISVCHTYQLTNLGRTSYSCTRAKDEPPGSAQEGVQSTWCKVLGPWGLTAKTRPAVGAEQRKLSSTSTCAEIGLCWPEKQQCFRATVPCWTTTTTTTEDIQYSIHPHIPTEPHLWAERWACSSCIKPACRHQFARMQAAAALLRPD